jgi:hypothetical protein
MTGPIIGHDRYGQPIFLEARVRPGEFALKYDAEGKPYRKPCICDPGLFDSTGGVCCHSDCVRGRDLWCYACRGWVGEGPGRWHYQERHICAGAEP